MKKKLRSNAQRSIASSASRSFPAHIALARLLLQGTGRERERRTKRGGGFGGFSRLSFHALQCFPEWGSKRGRELSEGKGLKTARAKRLGKTLALQKGRATSLSPPTSTSTVHLNSANTQDDLFDPPKFPVLSREGGGVPVEERTAAGMEKEPAEARRERARTEASMVGKRKVCGRSVVRYSSPRTTDDKTDRS